MRGRLNRILHQFDRILQSKHRDLHNEPESIVSHHLIRTPHAAGGRTETGEALIQIMLPRENPRLNTHNPLAPYFLDFALRIRDQPMAVQEFGRSVREIEDLDLVSPHIELLLRKGMLPQIKRTNNNGNSRCRLFRDQESPK